MLIENCIFKFRSDFIDCLVPASGCDAITSEGTCFKYFTSSGISWAGAKQECEAGDYYLAKITSLEEDTLMYTGVTDSGKCLIGLSDIDTEGTFVWTDGSNSSYMPWNPGQPDNNNEEDCVESLSLAVWNDFTCEIRSFACYFCSTEGKNSMSLNEESISVVKQERTFFTPKFDRICPKIVNFYAFLVSKIHKIFRLSKFSPKY